MELLGQSDFNFQVYSKIALERESSNLYPEQQCMRVPIPSLLIFSVLSNILLSISISSEKLVSYRFYTLSLNVSLSTFCFICIFLLDLGSFSVVNKLAHSFQICHNFPLLCNSYIDLVYLFFNRKKLLFLYLNLNSYKVSGFLVLPRKVSSFEVNIKTKTKNKKNLSCVSERWEWLCIYVKCPYSKMFNLL